MKCLLATFETSCFFGAELSLSFDDFAGGKLIVTFSPNSPNLKFVFLLVGTIDKKFFFVPKKVTGKKKKVWAVVFFKHHCLQLWEPLKKKRLVSF